MVVDLADDERFPPLTTGDLYVFIHDDGVISTIFPDGRAMQRPLAEVIDTLHGVQAAGGRVWLTGPVTDIGRRAAEAIAASNPEPIEAFTAPAAPVEWDNGACGFLAAARYGQDAVLDDLLARGVDLTLRDDLGNTALHSAVFGDNARAVERLVDAGVDVDARNAQGYTAEMVALAERSKPVLEVLSSADRPTRFRHPHWLTRATAVPALVLLTVVLTAGTYATGGPWPIGLVPGGLLAAFTLLDQGSGFPRGQVASVVSLRGTRLRVQRGTLRRADIDLTEVGEAAYLGPTAGAVRHGILPGIGLIAVPSDLGRPWPVERTERAAADPAESAMAARWPAALFFEYQRMWRDEVVPAVLRELVLADTEISPGLWNELLNSLAYGAELAVADAGPVRTFLRRTGRRYQSR